MASVGVGASNIGASGVGGVGGAGATPVRDVRLTPPGRSSAAPAPIQLAPSAATPGQILPRGSLLNLSV